MTDVEIGFNPAADETKIVDYVISSTDDINATPVVWVERLVVPKNASPGQPYLPTVPNHPNGNFTFKVESRDAQGDLCLTPLQGSENVQPERPPSPQGPLTITPL